ncbi:TonB-dependent receptor domain-containing protein [Yunchengibacter salinarum]|uniref:TonB-dependent receptor domain-containing protein n=1 Tax=Yunchengibacter salinarum TaxID=3133399 RepID=UPI0035B5A908
MKFALKASTALASVGVLSVAALSGGVHAQSTDEEGGDDMLVVEEISVTGSYIKRRSQASTASPIDVTSRNDLEMAGVTRIAEFANNLNINNGAQNNPDATTQNVSTGTSNINLRGLGVASTLVILNGKRTVVSGSQTDGGVGFVDTASLVPPIAVESVEVLKDGAGPLYGSDAVAGVVNFKTRDDFEGFEVTGEVKHVDGTDQRDITVGAITGWQSDRVSVMAAVNYMDRSNLSQRDRDLRSEEALAQNVSISTTTGLPGTFILPTVPLGDNLTDTIAFLSLFDQVQPDFTNALPSGFPAPPVPDQLAQLGVTTNPSPPQIPFPNIQGLTGLPGVPPAGQAGGFRPPNPANGEGVAFIPGPVAQALGLGDGPISLGADGIADALSAQVYNAIFSDPNLVADGVSLADAVAQQLNASGAFPVPITGNMLSFANPGAPDGAATPFFPDPNCAAAAEQFDDVVPLTETFTNPLDGSTTQVGRCGYDFNNQFDLVPDEERLQGYAQFEADVTDQATIYGSFSFARNRTTRGNSNFPITQTVPIAANNPFNTFRTDVLWAGRTPGSNFTNDPNNPNPSNHNSDTWRAMGGVKGDLSGSWTYDLSVVRAENDFNFDVGDGVASRFFLALQGFGGPNCAPDAIIPGTQGCEFFNPFGSGLVGDENAVVPVLDDGFNPIIGPDGAPVTTNVRNSDDIMNWIMGTVSIDIDSTISVWDAVTTGELFEGPGGTVSAAFGFQYRDERLAYDYDENTNNDNFLFVQGARDFDDSRDVYAFFGELLFPITEDLELTGALRYEDYGGSVGDTLDPKVSLLYNPTPDLSLRATWSSSFRAPSVFQQFGNQTSLNSVNDPRSDAAPFIAIRTTGREDLSPETADTFTAGFTWKPFNGFTFDVNGWRFEFRDVIIQESAQELVNRALLGGETSLIGSQVFLDPSSGGIIAINNQFENAAFINTQGIDVKADYVFDTDAGTFTIGGSMTWVESYNLPNFGGGEGVDLAGFRNRDTFGDPIPEFRGQANVSWVNERHMANVVVRHVGRLIDDNNSTFATQAANGLPDLSQPLDLVKVGDHTTVDLFYSYDLSNKWGMADGTNFNIGAVNVLDQRPPPVLGDGGFETRTHDPRGRVIYAGFQFGF